MVEKRRTRLLCSSFLCMSHPRKILDPVCRPSPPSRRLPGPSSYDTYLLRPAAIDKSSYVSSKTFFVDRRKWSSCAASLRISHTCSNFRTGVSSHHGPCRTPSAGHRSPYVSYEELPGGLGSPSQSLKSPTARVSMCHTAITQPTTNINEVLDFLSNFW